ncbi:MAG: hypothetical protein LBC65_02595, partial [Oscillospiraceae bacterium]|nr:hypothetical protein [Oscillospiraceae bacterium]
MTVTPNTPVTITVPAVRYWDESEAREVTQDAPITLSFPHTGLYWLWDGFTHQPHRQVTVYSPEYRTPDWIKGGVCYHIFVDRFASGVRSIPRPEFTPEWTDDKIGLDRCGGTLDGVRSNLDYLAELGVTCLYLSPIFEASSAHKYNTADYERVDPEFGDLEAFKMLCADAKALGIRVILDGVFSHCGSDSEYYRRHPGWFVYEPDGVTPKYWWGIESLPVFDKHNVKYIEYITGEGGIAERWLEAGASGWRLDVADELPDAFLDPLCRRIKAKDPDALIIGEVWEDASNKIAYGVRRRYFLGGQLDGTMNYPL